MTKIVRHLTAATCTALVSLALLAGAVGPARTTGTALAQTARSVA